MRLWPLILVISLLGGCSDASDAIGQDNPGGEPSPLPPDLHEYVAAGASIGSMSAVAEFTVPADLFVVMEATATWSWPSQELVLQLTSNGRVIATEQSTQSMTRLDMVRQLGSGDYRLTIGGTGVAADERIDLRATFQQEEQVPSREAAVGVSAMPSEPGHSDQIGAKAAMASAILLPFLAWLFSRIKGRELLKNPRRQAIVDLVEAAPGIHLSHIARHLGWPHQSVRHHLSILSRGGLVALHRIGTHTVAALPGVPEEVVVACAALRGRARTVAQALAIEKDTGRGVAKRLELAESTIHHHLQRLEGSGVAVRDSGSWRLTEVGMQALDRIRPSVQAGRS